MIRRNPLRTAEASVAPASLAALACCLLLSACAVGPDYKRPDVATPAAFTEDDTWKTAKPADDQPRGPWWKSYQDPVLDDLIGRVSITNQNVLSYAAQYRQATALLDAARASLLPTVTGTFAGTASQGTSAGGGAVVSGAPVTDTVRASASASWVVDLWGQISRNIESNEASAQASDADISNAILSAQSTLAQTYFQLRGADIDLKLLDDTVQSYERTLKITQDQYESGVAGKVNVAQAQAQLESTRAQHIDLGVARAQYEHAIAVLVGVPPSDFHITPTYALPALPEVPPVLPSTLLQRRPDIAGAERRMAAANALIGVAQSAFFPTLTLGASTGFQNNSINDLFSSPNNYWSVGPSMALTLFDFGARTAQKNSAIASYDKSVATYRQTVLTAFQQVEDNLAALRLLEREARVQQAASVASDQALDLTLNQYMAGTVSYLNVVTTQSTALTARRTLNDLGSRRLVASAALLTAIGGDWHAPTLTPAGTPAPTPAATPTSPPEKP